MTFRGEGTLKRLVCALTVMSPLSVSPDSMDNTLPQPSLVLTSWHFFHLHVTSYTHMLSLRSPHRNPFRPELRSLQLFKINLDSLFQEMGKRPFPGSYNLNLTWCLLPTSKVWYPKQMLSLIAGPCRVHCGTSRCGMWKDRGQEIVHKLYTPNDQDSTQPTPRVGGSQRLSHGVSHLRGRCGHPLLQLQRLLCSHLKMVPASAEPFNIADHSWSRKSKNIRDGTDSTNPLK